ncbi:MAG: Na+ dependent nucleoside transporter N-terminal domain-containing protein [Saprospiraceae bacterium]
MKKMFMLFGMFLSSNLFSQEVVEDSISVADKSLIENMPIIASQGFSFESLWKGVLGMLVLILIAWLFSSNRKKINWITAELTWITAFFSCGSIENRVCKEDI